MENLNAAIRKQGLLRGLLFGGIMLLVDVLKLYYLAYWAKSPMAAFIVLYVIYYIVLFGATLWFVSGLRNKIGRYWNLKQAITGIFIMLFVTSVLWNNGITLFIGKINPGLAKKAHTAFVDTRIAAMQSSHTSQKKINAEIASMNQTFVAGSDITVSNFIRSLFVSVILVFAVSALLGVLFKRERPVQAGR